MGYLLSPVVAALILLNSTIDRNLTPHNNETKNMTVAVSASFDGTTPLTTNTTFMVTSELNKVTVELLPENNSPSDEINSNTTVPVTPPVSRVQPDSSGEGFISNVSPAQAEEYENIGQETYEKIKELEESSKWRALPQKGIEKLKERRVTTFRGSVQIDIPAETMFEELWFRGSNTPEWHNQVETAMELANVTKHSKVLYQTAAPQANGMVSRRDFVTLSYYVKEGGKYYIVYQSVDFEGKPEVSGIVRGTNGPSAMIMEPVEREACSSTFTWYMNTNFNLRWIPASILRSLFPSFVQGYLDSVAEKSRQLRQQLTDC